MVNVKKSETNNRISVKSTKETNVFGIKDNLSEFYAKQAEKWATSEDIVNGVDYSSKYYAEQSKVFWGDVEVTKNEVQNLVTGFDSKVEESLTNIENETFSTINNINTNKTNAISEINSTKTSAINTINTNKNTAINEINSAGKSYDNLTHKQITNCLLEVPQNIKLELNNGTLTLKAGSKAPIPNGVGVFDEVVTTKDLIVPTPIDSGYNNTEFMLCIRNNGAGVDRIPATETGTDPSNPTRSWCFYYDTAVNKIYQVDGNGVVADRYYSFPIARLRAKLLSDGTSFAWEIVQVFNGFGYIGSTIWVNKGVKGLIPNGRNEDGSLKNIEVTTSKVSEQTLTSTKDRNVVLLASGNIDEPSGLVYSEAENRNYNFADIYNACDCGTVKRDSNGVITSLDIKQPFRAVDYADYKPAINNKVSKSGDTMTGTLDIKKPNGQYVLNIHTDGFIGSSGEYFSDFRYLKGNKGFATLRGSYYPSSKKSMFNLFMFDIDAGTGKGGMSLAYDATNGLRFEFPRCTTKATTTSSAANNRVAVVVQNYVNGASWYRVWSDGWIEQGGTTGATTTQKSVSFIKSFSTTNCTVIATDCNYSTTDVSGCHPIGIQIRSSSKFDIKAGGTASVRWYACGY